MFSFFLISLLFGSLFFCRVCVTFNIGRHRHQELVNEEVELVIGSDHRYAR